MKQNFKVTNSRFFLPALISIIVALLLSLVQVMADQPMIILERFIQGGGWIEIVVVSAYAWIISYYMQDPAKQAKWRVRAWSIFSIVFFSQLILGMLIDERFLMTGKLHLPIPMMIIAGPLYRMEISFMPVLFLSTIVLSGPAWCSQLCYFGAIDALAANRSKSNYRRKMSWLGKVKFSIIFIVVLVALLLRILKVEIIYSTIIAVLFGIIGLIVIFIQSRRKGRMIHCISYCPVGTVVNYFKFINPFRFRISDTCTSCMRCISECKYGALNDEAIANRKPGITCTLCGDCVSVCKPKSFYYKFPWLNPVQSRNMYLAITIILHSVFLALARM